MKIDKSWKIINNILAQTIIDYSKQLPQWIDDIDVESDQLEIQTIAPILYALLHSFNAFKQTEQEYEKLKQQIEQENIVAVNKATIIFNATDAQTVIIISPKQARPSNNDSEAQTWAYKQINTLNKETEQLQNVNVFLQKQLLKFQKKKNK